MGYKIFNVNEVEVKPKNNRYSHYDIKASVIDSSDFNTENLGFDIKVLEPGQLSYPYHYHSNMVNIGKNEIFKQEENVDYYTGEEEIPTFWRKDEI